MHKLCCLSVAQINGIEVESSPCRQLPLGSASAQWRVWLCSVAFRQQYLWGSSSHEKSSVYSADAAFWWDWKARSCHWKKLLDQLFISS